MSKNKEYTRIPKDKAYTRKLNFSGKTLWEMEHQEGQLTDNKSVFEDSSDIHVNSVCHPLPFDFKPSTDVLEYLMAFHEIPYNFIEMQIIEFKMYWHETKEKRKAWQSRFKYHVIYQWNKQKSETCRTSYKTTYERLTDYEWAEGFSFEERHE